MNKFYNSCFCFFLTTLFPVMAQEVLGLEDVVKQALKNSYSILVAQNQQQIAVNNNTPGNAGFLPQLTFNAASNLSNNKTNQEYASGLVINQNGVRSNGLNAGFSLNWTIFDGLKMFATHARLKELEAQSGLGLKVEIENTLTKVITAYYEVARQQQIIRAQKEALKVYEERIKISRKKEEIGSGSGQEVLQAQIDMNTQRSLLLKQYQLLDAAKLNLCQLMIRPVDQDFNVQDSIIFNYKPGYEELKRTVLSNNNQLQFSEKNMGVARQGIREYNALRLPQLTLNTTYNFSQSKNQVGFVLLNQNLGLNASVTAIWTLFNGLKNRTLVKNAELNLLQQENLYKQTLLVVETALLRAWKSYNSIQELLKLEEENALLVKENLKITLERFKTGGSTAIELMTAQKSYEEAMSRLMQVRFDAKIAETELKRLNGDLVK